MKRIVGVLVAILMACMLVVFPATPASARSCDSAFKQRTYTTAVTTEEGRWKFDITDRIVYKVCGRNFVITGFKYTLSPRSGCDLTRSVYFNPTPLAGVNPPAKRLFCDRDGSSTSQSVNILVFPDTSDRRTTIKAKFDLSGAKDQTATGTTFVMG